MHHCRLQIAGLQVHGRAVQPECISCSAASRSWRRGSPLIATDADCSSFLLLSFLCVHRYTGVPYNQNDMRISLGSIQLMEAGQPLDFDATAASKYLKETTSQHGTVEIGVSVGASHNGQTPHKATNQRTCSLSRRSTAQSRSACPLLRSCILPLKNLPNLLAMVRKRQHHENRKCLHKLLCLETARCRICDICGLV